jgi:tetratricopeptide (TPR) repeat protein
VDYSDPNVRKRLYIILGVLAGVLLVGGLAAKPAYRWFKEWRALQMVEASAQALRSKDLKTAQEKAESALRLWPNDARVTRQEARVLTLANPAAALPMWNQTWQLSNDLADLREVINAALTAGNTPVAIEQFAVLKKADPESPATWLLEGKIHFNQHQWPEAAAALKKVLDAGNAPAEVRLLYANAAFNTGDAVLTRESIKQLYLLTERSDQLGLSALRLLSTYPLLNDIDAGQVAEKLKNHPLAGHAEKLQALELESRLPNTSEESILQSARDLFPPNDPDAINIVGLWLMSQKKYSAVLQLIDTKTAQTHKDLFLRRADAMASLGQWQALEKMLSSTNPKPPLPEPERLMFDARALMELGERDLARLTWERAFNSVSTEPHKLFDMGVYAARIGLDDLARTAFQKVVKVAELRGPAYEQLVHLEHRARNTQAIYQLLQDMTKAYPDDSLVRSDTLYTGFLLGENGPEQLAAARKLVVESKMPFLAYRVTLALGLLTAGQPADALKVFSDLAPSTWPAGRASWDAVYVGVLRANGQRDEADHIERSINEDNLLPEEKKLLVTPLPPEVVK